MAIEFKIIDVAFGGKGVARENGKAIFIPYTIDGERVSARIVREKKNFADAELDEVLEPSSHRVTPECPYFGRCGGCSYQHIDYKHQLELKVRQVEQTLKRIGHFPDIPMQPIVPSPHSYGYRNRITVHCEDGVIGFYRRDQHRLIDIECCPISMPEVNDELQKLRASHPRDGHYTLRAHSGHRIFSQTNDAVAERLLDHVATLVPKHSTLLIDAYCGVGFFAKHLLDKVDRVVGIDWDAHAIAVAQDSATEKETYVAGDIGEELPTALVGAVHRTVRGRLGSIAPTYKIDLNRTTLIVDPPATGLGAKVRETIAELTPETFVYVSCNPPTLARDLADLRTRFDIETVTPFDMFPQTAEIEVAVKLRARSS